MGMPKPVGKPDSRPEAAAGKKRTGATLSELNALKDGLHNVITSKERKGEPVDDLKRQLAAVEVQIGETRHDFADPNSAQFLYGNESDPGVRGGVGHVEGFVGRYVGKHEDRRDGRVEPAPNLLARESEPWFPADKKKFDKELLPQD